MFLLVLSFGAWTQRRPEKTDGSCLFRALMPLLLLEMGGEVAEEESVAN